MKKNLAILAVVLLSFIFINVSNAQSKTPKRVTIFGDSYSTFEGCITPATNEPWYFFKETPQHCKDNDVVLAEQTWWYQVIERMGWQLEKNNSYSGSTVGFHGYPGKDGKSEDYTPRAFITRVLDLGNPDIILICAGTNDSWTGEEVGQYKYQGWTRQDFFTFRPAMARLCSDLKMLYPEAELLFILNSELREEINESVHTICTHYGVPCLDLQNIDKQAGHPSQKGMKAFADQVCKYFGVEK